MENLEVYPQKINRDSYLFFTTYFASILKTPDFCLVMKECKIKNKFLSKENPKGGYSFGLKSAKQTLELLRSLRLMSAEWHLLL